MYFPSCRTYHKRYTYHMSLPPRTERPLHWVGSAKRDLLSFPEGVVDEFGYELGVVQMGGQPPAAKP